MTQARGLPSPAALRLRYYKVMDSARGEPCRDGTLSWSDVPKLAGPWNSWAAQARATFNNRCKILYLLTDGRPHAPPSFDEYKQTYGHIKIWLLHCLSQRI